MALKKSDSIILTLSPKQYSYYQTGYSKVCLDVKVPEYIHFIFKVIIVTTMSALFIYFLEIKCMPTGLWTNISAAMPLVILAIPMLYFIFLPSILSQFDLYFIDAEIDMAHIPMSLPDKKTDRVSIATRILHPKYAVPRKQDDIFKWLYSWELQGFKANILLVVLNICFFAESKYLNKLIISLKLHKIQLLTYFMLLFVTALFAYFSGDDLSNRNKFLLGTLGLAWWCHSIVLYKSQIRNLDLWLGESRRQYKSINFPFFVWDTTQRCWQESHLDKLDKTFVEQYGLDAEKIITLTQGILLALHLTFFGLL